MRCIEIQSQRARRAWRSRWPQPKELNRKFSQIDANFLWQEMKSFEPRMNANGREYLAAQRTLKLALNMFGSVKLHAMGDPILYAGYENTRKIPAIFFAS